jgi:hypothetical protein
MAKAIRTGVEALKLEVCIGQNSLPMAVPSKRLNPFH